MKPIRMRRMGSRTTLIYLLTLVLQAGAIPGGDGAPAAHRQADCSHCHGFGGRGGAPAGTGGACLECHASGGASVADRLGFHGRAGRVCGDCHSFHEPRRLFTALGEAVLPAGGGGHCAACHGLDADPAALSPGHRRAGELYHGGELSALDPSEACLACHSRGDGALPEMLIPPETPRFNEHASHAYGLPLSANGSPGLRLRAVPDPRLRLFDGRIECATCHDLTAADPDLLVEFQPRYGLCQGCHEHGAERFPLTAGR